jgi:predicted anti-sigma-YlaC factor YlaD
LLTCKEFLSELSAYLDEQTDVELKAKIDKHAAECPNCWVVCDTTKKTIKVYKGMDACEIPPTIHDRLMLALEKKIAAGKS